jgi:hypothetical protein
MTLLEIEPAPTVRRDRWDRPIILPADAFTPDGTVLLTDKLHKGVGYQRATTLAKMLEDTSNLTMWSCRMTLIGAASRPDIIASVQATDPDDRKALNGLVEKAKELGGANVRRELGTAVHKFFELKALDATYAVPEPYTNDVDAILAAIDAAGFDIVTEFSERLVVVDTIQVAGTPDLILRRRSDDTMHIADLKTGSSVQWGALGWATQLSVYSQADALYVHGTATDGSEDRRLPMPTVSQHEAFIIHCEPGSGSAELHRLTIGAEFVDLAVAVRDIRKRRNLLTPFEGGGTDLPPEQGTAVRSGASAAVGPVDDPTTTAAAPVTDTGDAVSPSPVSAILHETRTAWIINRTTTCVDKLTAQHVAQVWPVDLPRPKEIKAGTAKWSERDIDIIAAALDALEAKHDLPFGETDPKVKADIDAARAAEYAAAEQRQRDNAMRKFVPSLQPHALAAEPFADPDDVNFAHNVAKAMATSGDPVEVARIRHIQQWQLSAPMSVSWKIGELDPDKVPLRLLLIVEAAIACAELIDIDAKDPDRRVRDLLAAVLDDDIAHKPTSSIGALFGLLTVDQAKRLAEMAEAITTTNSKETA